MSIESRPFHKGQTLRHKPTGRVGDLYWEDPAMEELPFYYIKVPQGDSFLLQQGQPHQFEVVEQAPGVEAPPSGESEVPGDRAAQEDLSESGGE